MKNKTRLLKRISSFFVFLLITFNSFAAVVSDNDGATFITKAEFDILKSSFQSQIDTYNQSIDSKIDGAISSYLAGIKLATTTTETLPFASWKKVTGIYSKIDNTYQLPSVQLSYNLAGNYDMANLSHTYNAIEVYSILAYMYYNKPSSSYHKRLLCDAGAESSTKPTYITWGGLAYDYQDKISLQRTMESRYNTGSYTSGKYLWDAITNRFILYYMTAIPYGIFDLSSATTGLWYPQAYWSESTHSGVVAISNADISHNNSFSISLGADSSGNKTTYDHIISYTNGSWDYFSDIDWLNTLGRHYTGNTTYKTRQGLYSSLTKKNTINILERPSGNSCTDVRNISSTSFSGYSGYGTSDTTAQSSVGLIEKNYTSQYIYQSADVLTQVVDGTTFTSTKDVLYEGFPLLAAKSGDKIEWKPEFIDRKISGSTNNFELDITLATKGKFSTDTSLASGAEKIKLNGQTTAGPVTTSSGKATITFTMPDDGIVYVKWWPNNSSYRTSTWEAALDLTKCGTYLRTKM